MLAVARFGGNLKSEDDGSILGEERIFGQGMGTKQLSRGMYVAAYLSDNSDLLI